MISFRRFITVVAGSAGLVGVTAATASAQWSTSYEQFYLPGPFNWAFRHSYPAADRLFNAFDYGHAILYEKLYTRPQAPVSLLEEKEYNFITRELLTNPPRLPLEESAIEPQYSKLAPEAKLMFDWAHLLHRQIYDVWADERIPLVEKDARIGELIRYYKTRPDLAFSSIPKSMELMEGQYYSLAFRQKYPKFNGLIWAYHWLQVGLYEPLVAGKTVDERQTGVIAAVARFKQMLESPPSGMPRIMPMTSAVAPKFAERYPEASIIFDNLHSMHDVVSDILASPKVPRNQKRAEILKAASRYRDSTSFVLTEAEWREMSHMMGIQNMGGPSVGFLAALPVGTVERGAVHNMAGIDHSKMNMTPAQNSGNVAGQMKGMDHSKMNMPGMQPATDSAKSPMMHEMDHGKMAGSHGDSAMMAMHMLMMADPVIRERMLADPEMRKMMSEMMSQMDTTHMRMMQHTHKPTARKAVVRKNTAKKSAARKPAAAKAPVKKAPVKKPTPKKDPMAGMDHSKMKM
ncbi:MAG: hypothetical protein H0U64_03420 [Gemmatimonadaceae bacterium]|nr:hypothetical protein [Gemmatimonadaceae bacterium]